MFTMIFLLVLFLIHSSSASTSNLFPYGYPVQLLPKIPQVDFCYADASQSDINYYLFKSLSQYYAIILKEENYIFTSRDANVSTKVFVHGYKANVTTPWLRQLKEAYFKKGTYNIIYVDWTQAARVKNYTISAANIGPVGEFIADYLIHLKVPLRNVHLIGHSLGGHLVGFVGKNILWKTGTKVARITALDPAGPGFDKVVPDLRLSRNDAKFVDVLHTDSNYFGTVKPLGHVDFYVNGGKNQPGCKAHDTDENCHHVRSTLYFIESVNKMKVLAKSAEINEKEEIEVNGRYEIPFGDSTPTDARGVFYLKTHAAPPFLIQKVK